MLRRGAATVICATLCATGCARQPEAPRQAGFAASTVSAVTAVSHFGADVLLRPETEVIEARVPRHATLDSLLRDHQFAPELIQAAVESAAGVFNPRHLRADRPYRLVRSLDGWLREFIYEIDTDRFLRIVNLDRTHPVLLNAQVLPFEKEIEVLTVHGQIDAAHPSLVAAVDGAGERIELAMELAEVFGGQIDFENELQRGDGFDVLFEKSTRGGQFAGYGSILAATFVADGDAYQAFRWVDPATGTAAYYDADGRSLRRFFLMSPLRFEPRITSPFSRSRLHPVHHTRQPHLGVDYEASYGAAVVSVASGTVVSAGWAGAGGKQVHLRHAGGFETFYLHLSSFAKGIRPGARVNQGELIGRVGATGTATGPHLDFRLRKDGAFVDPVRERRRQPPGQPIPPSQMASFREQRDGLARQISTTVVVEAPRPKPDDAGVLKAIQ
jgi:murein DD-endopeptidase MepM/ murein hydrolase activator NlpD